MELESYGVHNLVTTVTGLLAENVGPVDAVKRCFPPGQSCLLYESRVRANGQDQ
jgi:hypothetical protein